MESASRNAGWLPWCGAFVVFVAALAELRHGAALNPDAWAYWSGSVSMLEGRGYVDAFGLSIRDWPPGYSAWLALVQSVLGVRVSSVVVADALAAAASSGFAIAWGLWRARRAGVGAARWPIAAFACAVPLCALRGPSSELPALASFAAALWAVERWRIAPAPGARWITIASAAAAGMVAMRHVGLALAAGIAAMLLLSSAVPRRRRALAAASVLIAALLAWWSLRAATGQTGSHPWGPGTRSLGEIAAAMVHGIDRCLAPFPLGATIAAAAALAGGPLQRWCAARGATAASVRHTDVVACALVGLAATAAMFCFVQVVDAPGPRFVRFAALLLGIVAIVIAAALPRPRWRLLTLLVLVLPSSLQAGRYVLLGRIGRDNASAAGGESFLPWHATLRAGVPAGTVLPDGRLVVAMPRFQWLADRLERAGER